MRGGKRTNGRQSAQAARQDREADRRQAARGDGKGEAAIGHVRQAEASLRRQPADRQGHRRRSRAGLHRGHAGLEARRGRRLDALIVATVPKVAKAVKWNSPFYGMAEGSWFLSFHCFDKYIKVAFFRGASLRPVPPGASKQKDVRYLDIYETDPLDQAQFTAWVKQASKLPGEKM